MSDLKGDRKLRGSVLHDLMHHVVFQAEFHQILLALSISPLETQRMEHLEPLRHDGHQLIHHQFGRRG